MGGKEVENEFLKTETDRIMEGSTSHKQVV
jgi:hypothetical protein